MEEPTYNDLAKMVIEINDSLGASQAPRNPATGKYNVGNHHLSVKYDCENGNEYLLVKQTSPWGDTSHPAGGVYVSGSEMQAELVAYLAKVRQS